MSARKVGMLLLLLAVGGGIEAAFQLRNHVGVGPEGCRVMGGRFYGPSYAFEQAEERAVPGAPQVEVRNAFGDVRVVAGSAGLVKARVRKVVYLPTEERARAFAERIELQLAREGPSLRIGTNREAISREDVGFETHLDLEVPPDSAVRIRNEHGEVSLSGVASGDIVSSFEAVSVERLAGDLKLENRHGETKVASLGGALQLTCRHGAVEVVDVKGPVKLDVQHGEIEVQGSGPLEIAQQHGRVTAVRVNGKLIVRASHAEVRGTDVREAADVETSFGAVHLTRIGGTARARVDHGEVTAEDVAGEVAIETSFDGVRLDRVAGHADVSVRHGGLEAKGLLQGARVRTSGADVSLDGFAGPLDLEVDRGSVELSPRRAIAAAITVQVSHGDARVDLPEGSRVDLVADSRRGDVQAELPGLAPVGGTQHENRRGEHLEARLGGGGVSVQVHADGDISLGQRAGTPMAEDVAPPRLSPATSGPAEATPPGVRERRTLEATPVSEKHPSAEPSQAPLHTR